MDFPKAFDNVRHHLLVKKVKTSPLSLPMVNWSVADPGSAPTPLLIFRPNWGPNGRNFFIFLETVSPSPPPLSKGLDDRDPKLSQGLDPALLEQKLFDRPKTKGNIRRNSLWMEGSQQMDYSRQREWAMYLSIQERTLHSPTQTYIALHSLTQPYIVLHSPT